MAFAGSKDDGAPMGEMNTTPLIDVMLVLLIMFIITVPMQAHSIRVDLPQGQSDVVIDETRNNLAIDAAGTISWNGLAVDRLSLRSYLQQSMRLPTEPALQFHPDAQARFVVVDDVLAEIKKAGVTKLWFVGNDRYQKF